MKHLKLIVALLISMSVIFSCNPKQDKQDTSSTNVKVEPPIAQSSKKDISEVLTASEIQSLTASINGNASKSAKGKPVKLSQTVTVAAPVIIPPFTLTDNGGGSFSINYGGATNLVTMFFRGGDSLSTVSGNVYPTAVLQYAITFTSWTATFSRANYQSVVVTGTIGPDANGVVGADWVFTYTNVVQ